MAKGSFLNAIKTQRFSEGFDAKLIIATGGRATLEISPLTKTPVWKPLKFSGIFMPFSLSVGCQVLRKQSSKIGSARKADLRISMPS